MPTVTIIVCAISLFSSFPIDSSIVNGYPNEKTIEKSSGLELTAEDVINKYLQAIGGKTRIKSIIDRSTTMSGNVMGKKLSIITQQKTPNKLKQEIDTGTIKQVIIFNGIQGVVILGEEQSSLEGNELAKLKIEAQMNFLLNPELYGVKTEMVGIEIIDSVQCYNISMSMEDSTEWNQYYEVESGLKIKEIKSIKTPQGLFNQESLFSDYREVDRLKYPFKITQTLGAQTIDLTVEKIETNTGLQDILFEIPE
ncbi:MAG: hypothetical protein P8X73_01355 [Ignavibacteriaceae bacterium]